MFRFKPKIKIDCFEDTLGPREKRMVDKNLEALRGADADKERTERVVGEVTLEVCSAEESFGNEPTETERKLERKPYNTSSGRN